MSDHIPQEHLSQKRVLYDMPGTDARGHQGDAIVHAISALGTYQLTN